MKKKTPLTLNPQNGHPHITNSEENFLVTVSFESNRERTSLAKIRPKKNLPLLRGKVDCWLIVI